MQNKEYWKESKYLISNGKIIASSNIKEVSLPSRNMANNIGKFYEKVIPKYANGLLLDLGCGKVPLYKAYKPYVTDNVCVDWGNSIHENNYLDVETDLNEKLPFDDSSFDTIILSDVFEHIKEPNKLWEEIARILKEDGILIINVPFYYWLHEEPHDYYRYTKYALVYLGEKHGFDVLENETLGGFPEVLCDLISRIMIHIPLFGRLFVKIIISITSFFTSTDFGKRFVFKTSSKFPYAYGFVYRKIQS